MKQIYLILFIILFATTLKAQDRNNEYLLSKLVAGHPPQASFLVDQFTATNLKYTSLQTGVDSIQVLLGSFVRDQNQDYYVIIFYNDKFEFKTFSLEKNGSSEILSNKLDLDFNNSSMLVSVQVNHNPSTDEVSYKWLNQNGSSKIATIQLIGLIHQNKPMPDFNTKTLDGQTVALNDFKGKYLVINWWSTGCGPCIKEMPVLNKMVEKYKSRKDVAFVAMAWDEKEKLKNFLSKRSFRYQQTFNKELATIFGESFPKHVIVNPQGIVTYYSSGLEMEMVEGKVEMKKHLGIEEALDSELKNK
ncbi:MAG: hypothetical protein COW65_10855 [Cytophagales bacterium CG18_big_fil_WC_8_21_14_2_50_42_9]|nr:MAG: hypothetical protein COW65_10855 [Cytophagales bacterium CG18_big_fil_WC_8_21_14_2_50_42_9]